ncbi:alpha-ketoglutarate-dependent taurine dioxygenase [Streptacidiphilus sp. BW17]|uniref:TauD/TfdA family dioxygenase n=1 Tax=Streptacidiphilus sp. BW17 TaxID=3156274 RepID=UPI003519AB26
MTTAARPGIARLAIPEELARRDPDLTALAALLRPLAETHLDSGSGYFILSGLDRLDPAEFTAFTLAAAGALGRLVPQDSKGTLLREVRDRGVKLGEGATGRYSDSRQGGNLHTDSPHRPGTVPDYFALGCVYQAAVGGELLLVPLADVLERLAERADVLEALHTPVYFDTRDDAPGAPRTVLRPVLEEREDGTHVHYLREYIEIGHRQPGTTPLTQVQLRAFDALDDILDDPGVWRRERLSAGEIVFIDNRWTLHGRTEFVDHAGAEQRLMIRVWISAD